MKGMKRSWFIASLFVTVAMLLLPAAARAAGPSFTLYPSTGYALIGENFAVDVMLDTGGENVTMARAVFRFDPTEVRVTKAEYGELFCQYPEDDYTVDNTLGWVKLTGFCLDPYYNSSGTPGLFGRFTFVPLVQGETTFTFVRDYTDEEWESALMNAGSPPQQLSGLSVSGGTYTAVASIDGAQPVDGTLPGVGLFDDKRVLLGSGLFALGIAAVVTWNAGSREKKQRAGKNDRTVVL
jgi:hypothetical protein